jgi:hypothetical protein
VPKFVVGRVKVAGVTDPVEVLVVTRVTILHGKIITHHHDIGGNHSFGKVQFPFLLGAIPFDDIGMERIDEHTIRKGKEGV